MQKIHNYELKDWQLTAADYAMHVPDTTQKVLYPPGQWNSSRIIFTPNNVEHWLNGKKGIVFCALVRELVQKKKFWKMEQCPGLWKIQNRLYWLSRSR
jgi:hypothetical protein